MLTMMLTMMGVSITADQINNIAKAMKPKMIDTAKALIPNVKAKFLEGDLMDPETLRTEVDQMLTDRLQEIHEEDVKQLLEEVIRKHLHWLIIWGNVFGGLLGLLSAIAELP